MLSPVILVPAVLNGLMTGAVYALVALGLTLIYGVLHIINFAHGALLTAAMFAAFFAYTLLGLDPYRRGVSAGAAILRARLCAAALCHRAGGAWRGSQFPAGYARACDRDRECAALFLPRRHPHHQPALCLRRGRTRLRFPRCAASRCASAPSFAVALVLWAHHAIDRHRQSHPRRGQGEARRRTLRHRCRAYLCDHLRARHRLRRRRRLPADPDLLRQSAPPAMPSC